MDYVFALDGPRSVAWGVGGVWIVKDEPWFADDPFVADHPELFSAIPPQVRSTVGRTIDQAPLPAPTPRGRRG